MKFNINTYWYSDKPRGFIYLLIPFSWFFRFIVYLRRYLYKLGIFKTHTFPVPIIVVGNITVGGTGKTPLVIWLIHLLKNLGFKPGVVSRGFGKVAHCKPHFVTMQDEVAFVGDEAKLIAKHSPLVIAKKRALAVAELLAQTDCNIVISDDGLQHYRLARDIEIVLIDGMRLLGNQLTLPAGPLREGAERLKEVDYILMNQTAPLLPNILKPFYTIEMKPIAFVSLTTEASFPPHLLPFKKVHAVAAIGNPQRFFQSLRALGLDIIEHIFPDHYLYQAKDFMFSDDLPIIMTEKDAVKCYEFAKANYWYVATQLKVDDSFVKKLTEKITEVRYVQKNAQCSTLSL